MPIYEYRCEKCGDFEVTQRINDKPIQRCPECRRKVRRLISSTSFQLKGSGWYVTDYARSGAGKGGEAAKSETATTSDTKSSDTKASDTKPATKKAKSESKSSASSAAAGSGGES